MKEPLLGAHRTHFSPLVMGSGIEVKLPLLGAVGRCWSLLMMVAGAVDLNKADC